MSNKFIKKSVFGLVIVILLATAFIAGRIQKDPVAVQAQEILEGEDRFSSFGCYLDNVAAFENRIHIRCTTAAFDDVKYFAIENTRENEELISRVMAISLTNMTMNWPVWVYYEASSSYNPPGCNTGDCRKLVGVSGVK